MDSKPDIYFVGGPTASGKTARALELAAKLHGIVINADAMQVYRGLPILTAQPTTEEKAQAPHRLFEIFDPTESGSAGRWAVLARQEIAQACAQGQAPIVVGGTGLYFAALLGKLADIPPIPQEVHDEAVELYEALGHDAFRVRLSVMDEESTTRIKPNDRQRLIRAYEVVNHTRKTLGYWQRSSAGKSLAHTHTIHTKLLMPPRDDLYVRCDARFLKMVERGALDEVQTLLTLNLDADKPAMKILGVPELAKYLRGACSLDDAIAAAQQATRNYAKRQVTWFKNQWGGQEKVNPMQ
ncbi:MAG: tRNA (adenosine(37)-N6)-dimethylallyltransferase MiaA [Proteobacteria bacterium]|nr:tRNA (adenosine(37)-N6)-dimethylallyltransferase MiaA [Pseudomonadota bacterium]